MLDSDKDRLMAIVIILIILSFFGIFMSTFQSCQLQLEAMDNFKNVKQAKEIIKIVR